MHGSRTRNMHGSCYKLYGHLLIDYSDKDSYETYLMKTNVVAKRTAHDSSVATDPE